MAECTHCNGDGRCSDEWHDVPLAGLVGDTCPSCGRGGNEEAICPHCEGTGWEKMWPEE